MSARVPALKGPRMHLPFCGRLKCSHAILMECTSDPDTGGHSASGVVLPLHHPYLFWPISCPFPPVQGFGILQRHGVQLRLPWPPAPHDPAPSSSSRPALRQSRDHASKGQLGDVAPWAPPLMKQAETAAPPKHALPDCYNQASIQQMHQTIANPNKLAKVFEEFDGKKCSIPRHPKIPPHPPLAEAPRATTAPLRCGAWCPPAAHWRPSASRFPGSVVLLLDGSNPLKSWEQHVNSSQLD